MARQADAFEFDASSAKEGSSAGKVAAGLSDLAEGIAGWRLWTMLAGSDLRQRYRRSVLGPFWMTISIAVFTAVLGAVYSTIFATEIAVHVPYVAAGLIAWGFVAATVTEGCNAFVENAAVIRQLRLPFSTFVLRALWRGVLGFGHTAVLMIPVALLFRLPVGAVTLLVVPGFLLVCAHQLWLALVLAILGTRFRDVPPLAQTVLQVAVLATPIMWPADLLSDSNPILLLNPAHHLVSLVRDPLLGQPPAPASWAIVGGLCIVGFLLAGWLLQRSRARLVYWL